MRVWTSTFDSQKKEPEMQSLSIAADILKIARENDVPLRPDPALVGALASFDVGAQIPPDLCRAVAEVLAFVYGLEGKG